MIYTVLISTGYVEDESNAKLIFNYETPDSELSALDVARRLKTDLSIVVRKDLLLNRKPCCVKATGNYCSECGFPTGTSSRQDVSYEVAEVIRRFCGGTVTVNPLPMEEIDFYDALPPEWQIWGILQTGVVIELPAFDLWMEDENFPHDFKRYKIRKGE